MEVKLKKDSFLKNINWRSFVMIFVLVFVWIIFSILTKGLFFSSRNLTLLLRQATILGTVAIGAVITIVTGNFDISVGSVVALNATIAAILDVNYGWGVFPIIIMVLLAGMTIGIWNGFLVAKVGIPSFIVTLGGMMLFRGVQLLISQGKTIGTMSDNFEKISNEFLSPTFSGTIIFLCFLLALVFIFLEKRFDSKYGINVPMGVVFMKILGFIIFFGLLFYMTYTYKGFPYPVVILAVLVVIATVMMTQTKFGRHLYATGGNAEAAELTGIRTNRTVLSAFLIMGILTGVAGILLVSRLSAAAPNAGLGLEMDAIASAVIGGTSIYGGVGTVIGAIIGSLILASIDNGMSLLNISSFTQYIIKGMILVSAVAFDVRMKGR